MRSEYVETVGVGFGPAGIAIAAAFEDEREAGGRAGHALFLEQRNEATWQPGMLLRGTDIQHHYFRDLATPRNPRSYFTFVNYLKEKGRLYAFGELVFGAPGGAVSRLEWADYVKWAGDALSDWAAFGQRVTKLDVQIENESLVGFVVNTETKSIACQNLILASGRAPVIPNALNEVRDKTVHSSEFLERIDGFGSDMPGRVAILGAGQSAIEIAVDLHTRLPHASIDVIHGGPGFRHVDLCQFSNTLFHPAAVDAFHSLAPGKRERLLSDMKSLNYGVVDPQAADVLYRLLYEDEIQMAPRVKVHQFVKVVRAEKVDPGLVMTIESDLDGQISRIGADLLIACTGFDDRLIADYAQVLERLVNHDEAGIPLVTRDYELSFAIPATAKVFVAGTAEATHGFSDSASFSMIAERAERIARCLNRLPDGTSATMS